MGRKGTFGPRSCEMARARAVFPVPGGPARRTARPDILRALMRSTMMPQAWGRRLG